MNLANEVLYLVSCIVKLFVVLHDLAFERCSQPVRQFVYSDLTVIGIWSSRLFELAGLLLHWTVGWSGTVDRKASNFVLNGTTDLDNGKDTSRTARGRRLKHLAPLTARLDSATRLT